MNWGGWSGFWAMGGHAFYVWGAYGVTLAGLALEALLLWRRAREAQA